MPLIQTQLDLLDSIRAPDARRAEIAAILTDMATERPDYSGRVIAEYRAIKDLMNGGATVPQIAAAFDIAESLIIARLRIGNMLVGLFDLFEAGRMSVTLAQRLGAESLQTQTRIWSEWCQTSPQPTRLTASFAYPERPQDEQIRLLPTTAIDATSLNALSTTDIFSMLDDAHKIEFSSVLFRTMQPETLMAAFEHIPSQTMRELHRRVYARTTMGTEWSELAEAAIPLGPRMLWASRYIETNNAAPFLSLLSVNARNRVLEFYRSTFNVQHATIVAERDEMRGNNETLRLEVERQRRQLEQLATGRGVRIPLTPDGVSGRATTQTTEPEGRAYREMLRGETDDPSERGVRATGDEAISGAQYDYTVPEESWGAVVVHLTDAADALPLSPSDECDRFHVDVEALRLRAIEQERLENANAGVVAGTVIPPSPATPEPSEANRGNVRATRSIADAIADERRAPRTLNEHASLLSEQAEAINANTTRRTPRAESELPPRRTRPRRETSERPIGLPDADGRIRVAPTPEEIAAEIARMRRHRPV